MGMKLVALRNMLAHLAYNLSTYVEHIIDRAVVWWHLVRLWHDFRIEVRLESRHCDKRGVKHGGHKG